MRWATKQSLLFVLWQCMTLALQSATALIQVCILLQSVDMFKLPLALLFSLVLNTGLVGYGRSMIPSQQTMMFCQIAGLQVDRHNHS